MEYISENEGKYIAIQIQPKVMGNFFLISIYNVYNNILINGNWWKIFSKMKGSQIDIQIEEKYVKKLIKKRLLKNGNR